MGINKIQFGIILIPVITACAPIVPATTPPQLEHTPGAFVVVTDETFDAGVFTVDYPSSWRVVKTSIAEADHMQVVFVAPDATITLTEVDAAADPSDGDEQFITLDDGTVVQVLIERSNDPDEHFAVQAQQLIASIRS